MNEKEQFSTTINGIAFDFAGFMEGQDEVYRVTVDNQRFKMTLSEDGNWEILQQVPSWIKKLETDLGNAIKKAYC